MAVSSVPALLFPLAFAALLLATVAVLLWRVRVRRARRLARRRSAGYQLMDCLKAYTAWIDWHRQEPLLQQSSDDTGIPAALRMAVLLKDEHFPELSGLMLQLLQTHRELMEYLWEENILRMTHAAPLHGHAADPLYHSVRDRQDATLDSLFLRCRQLIGDSEVGWRRTQSDFSFSSSLNAPSRPF